MDGQQNRLKASQDVIPRAKPLLSTQRNQSVANTDAKTAWKSPNLQRKTKTPDNIIFTKKRHSSSAKDQRAFFTEPYYVNDRPTIEAIQNWRLESRVCFSFLSS